MTYRKTVLTNRDRVIFDPKNLEHMRDYAQFVKNNNWKNGCNYLLEDPFHDIPSMINDKIIRDVLSEYAV
jgi:hypothetical protein